MLSAGSHAHGLATSPRTCMGWGGVSGPSEDPESDPQRWAHFHCRRSLFPEGGLLLPGREAGGSWVVSGLPLVQSNGVAGLEAAGLTGVCSLQHERCVEEKSQAVKGSPPGSSSFLWSLVRAACGGPALRSAWRPTWCPVGWGPLAVPSLRTGPGGDAVSRHMRPLLSHTGHRGSSRGDPASVGCYWSPGPEPSAWGSVQSPCGSPPATVSSPQALASAARTSSLPAHRVCVLYKAGVGPGAWPVGGPHPEPGRPVFGSFPRRQRGHCGGHGLRDVQHHEHCLPQRREGPQCPETSQ